MTVSLLDYVTSVPTLYAVAHAESVPNARMMAGRQQKHNTGFFVFEFSFINIAIKPDLRDAFP